MYEISIIYPVTIDAIKRQDDSLNDAQCNEVLKLLEKTTNIEIGVNWMEILKAINICRINWN